MTGKVPESRKKYLNYLFFYSICFLLVSAGVFVWFILKHRSFCWTTDTSSQYIPKAVQFISWVREQFADLMRGELEFRMYDFSIGFGDAVPLHMEPVYWLYLLFDEKHIEYAYGLLILFRYYLAGLSMSAFLFYFHTPVWESLVGSMVYVFSGYGLFAGMRHSHFIIPMIMLPLMLLGIEEIYKKKRWYLCTVFVAVSFWCGYYFTYMNTLIMGVYFLIRFFGGEEKKSFRIFVGRAGVIIGSYLLGIGIANITFFNTFADYLTSSRSGIAVEKRVSLWSYGEGWIQNFYESFLSAATTPGRWLCLGFIPFSYLCIVLLFLRRKNGQYKAAFVTGTVFCMVPVFGYIMNGFGTLNNRWCYAYAFVVAAITAKMAGELKRMTGRELLLCFVSILPYLYFGIGLKLLGKPCEDSVVFASVLLLGTWALLLLIHLWKRMPGKGQYVLLSLNVLVLLWGSGMMRFSPYFDNMIKEFTKAGKVWDKATDTELQVMDEISDDTFYRSYTRNSYSDVQGASMMLGYNGVVYYSSAIGKPLIDFYRELGLTSWSLVRLRGFDGRGFLGALGCVKYEVIGEENPYTVPYGYQEVRKVLRNEVYYRIYENENVLPLGYCYDKVMSWEEFHSLETAKRQEVMIQAAVMDEIEENEPYELVTAQDAGTDGLAVTGKKVEITKTECGEGIEFDGKTLKVKEKNAELTLYFEGMPRSETYVNFEGLRMPNAAKVWFYFGSDGEEDEISYCYHGDYNTYATGQEDYLFNLGYSQEGKNFCTIRFNKKCTLNMEALSVYCQPMESLTEYTRERKEYALENIAVGTNSVSGTVDIPEERLLVLSIPYQSGWRAYVDGNRTEIRRANVMYMGLDLPAGEHTIELRFEIPGIRLSLVISALSFGIFIIALIIRRKRKNAA